MITTYIGIVDGFHTWEVRNEAGEVVGFNQSVSPGEGWTLDTTTGIWVEAEVL